MVYKRGLISGLCFFMTMNLCTGEGDRSDSVIVRINSTSNLLCGRNEDVYGSQDDVVSCRTDLQILGEQKENKKKNLRKNGMRRAVSVESFLASNDDGYLTDEFTSQLTVEGNKMRQVESKVSLRRNNMRTDISTSINNVRAQKSWWKKRVTPNGLLIVANIGFLAANFYSMFEGGEDVEKLTGVGKTLILNIGNIGETVDLCEPVLFRALEACSMAIKVCNGTWASTP